MSITDYNRQLVADYFDALSQDGIDGGKKFWADDMVFYQAGHSHLAGEYHGAEDFLKRWVQPLLDMTDNRWNINAAPEILMAGEDGVVIIADEYMIRAGKGRIDTKKLVVYTIEGDKLTSCRMYDGDQGAIDDFWS